MPQPHKLEYSETPHSNAWRMAVIFFACGLPTILVSPLLPFVTHRVLPSDYEGRRPDQPELFLIPIAAQLAGAIVLYLLVNIRMRGPIRLYARSPWTVIVAGAALLTFPLVIDAWPDSRVMLALRWIWFVFYPFALSHLLLTTEPPPVHLRD